MKIAIISHPRSCSSKLIMILSSMYQVNNLSELISYLDSVPQKISKIEQMRSLDNYAVKFHTHHLRGIPLDVIPWNGFDILISTHRRSTIDTFLSTQLAIKRNVWSRWAGDKWEVDDFLLDPLSVKPWFDRYHKFNDDMLEQIHLLTTKKIIRFEFEEIADDDILENRLNELAFPKWDRASTAAFIPSDINYREKCLNYSEIESEFKLLGIQP